MKGIGETESKKKKHFRHKPGRQKDSPSKMPLRNKIESPVFLLCGSADRPT